MGRDYTYSELMAMQEEATQRVREMQRRAQLTAQRAQEELAKKEQGKKPEHDSRAQPAQEPPRRQEDRRPMPAARPRQQSHISMPVDYLHEERDALQEACGEQASAAPLEKPAAQEVCRPKPAQPEGSDQSLLLALMLLLGGESTDELLLLALLYIMM